MVTYMHHHGDTYCMLLNVHNIIPTSLHYARNVTLVHKYVLVPPVHTVLINTDYCHPTQSSCYFPQEHCVWDILQIVTVIFNGMDIPLCECCD